MKTIVIEGQRRTYIRVRNGYKSLALWIENQTNEVSIDTTYTSDCFDSSMLLEAKRIADSLKREN